MDTCHPVAQGEITHLLDAGACAVVRGGATRALPVERAALTPVSAPGYGVSVVAPGPNWIEPPSKTQGVVGPPPGLSVTWYTALLLPST